MTDTAKTYPSKAATDAVEQIWRDRVKSMGYNPKHTSTRKAEVEFFCGAMAAFDAMGYNIPVVWTVTLMSGRPIYKEEA